MAAAAGQPPAAPWAAALADTEAEVTMRRELNRVLATCRNEPECMADMLRELKLRFTLSNTDSGAGTPALVKSVLIRALTHADSHKIAEQIVTGQAEVWAKPSANGTMQEAVLAGTSAMLAAHREGILGAKPQKPLAGVNWAVPKGIPTGEEAIHWSFWCDKASAPNADLEGIALRAMDAAVQYIQAGRHCRPAIKGAVDVQRELAAQLTLSERSMRAARYLQTAVRLAPFIRTAHPEMWHGMGINACEEIALVRLAAEGLMYNSHLVLSAFSKQQATQIFDTSSGLAAGRKRARDGSAAAWQVQTDN